MNSHSIWVLLDNSGMPIPGTAREDNPKHEHYASSKWVEFSIARDRENQCAEVCERAKLCATCAGKIGRDDEMICLLRSAREFVHVYVNSSFFGANAKRELSKIDAKINELESIQ